MTENAVLPVGVASLLRVKGVPVVDNAALFTMAPTALGGDLADLDHSVSWATTSASRGAQTTVTYAELRLYAVRSYSLRSLRGLADG